jgi:hypothetical protein
MISKYLSLFVILVSCIEHSNRFIDAKDISKIDIENITTNYYIPKSIEITDFASISKIADEINNLIQIKEVNVKDNFGYYEMRVRMKNNTKVYYNIIYTRYNGVVIDGTNILGVMTKYYKNDNLELFILKLFNK